MKINQNKFVNELIPKLQTISPNTAFQIIIELLIAELNLKIRMHQRKIGFGSLNNKR